MRKALVDDYPTLSLFDFRPRLRARHAGNITEMAVPHLPDCTKIRPARSATRTLTIPEPQPAGPEPNPIPSSETVQRHIPPSLTISILTLPALLAGKACFASLITNSQ